MKWERKTLGDITNIFSGYAFKSSSMSKNEGIPLIKIKNILSNSVAEECDTYLIPDKIDPNMDKFILQQGDFLVAMTGQGSVGRIGRMKKVIRKFYVNQRVAIVRTNLDIANPSFVYYQIATKQNEKVLFDKANGAGQPNISAKQIGELPVALPTIDIQDKIASILSAYDDLIENNHKQIKLLEEAAQRLYKEWFVDLRFPNYENTKVVDGVPEGWRKKTVLDMSAVLRRGISPKYNESGKYTVINQKCIRQTIMDIKESRKQEKEYAADMNLKDSDIVICSTGAGTLGRVGQVFGEYPDTTFDSHVTLIRAKNDNNNAQFLFWSLKNIQPFLMTLGQGSTNQLELPKRVIESCEIIYPTVELIQSFEKVVQPIHDKITALVSKIKSATEARDRLLPKLMNGELEV